MHLCDKCYKYEPHCHEDRLSKIPSAEIVFVCGNSDISFCTPQFTHRIIDAIEHHKPRKPQIFYFQSKYPSYFEQFLARLPSNVILVTTLETNRDSGYIDISKAPRPSERYKQFKALDYPRKVVTVEPILDFDEDVFFQWIIDLTPEYIWLGLNSKHEMVQLPEPSPEKLCRLVKRFNDAGIEVRGKELVRSKPKRRRS